MVKAFVFTEFGGPEYQQFAEVPTPAPGPGELLVGVRAAAVNPSDWKIREGYLGRNMPLPAVLGRSVAGVVEQIGEGVTAFQVGDEIFGATTLAGGFVEQTIVAERVAARKPANVSFVDASTLPISAATGYDGIEHLGLAAGDTLLIVGVGGGVGTAAAQVAISCGITVIGTAGPGKREFVEALGVTHVANGDGVADRIRAAAPDGIDGVYDLVGGPALDDVAEFAPPGKLITAGDPDTAAKYGGVSVQRDATGSTLVALATLVEQGSFKALVSQVLPFDEAATALDAVEQGHATGKVVIEIEGRGR